MFESGTYTLIDVQQMTRYPARHPSGPPDYKHPHCHFFLPFFFFVPPPVEAAGILDSLERVAACG